MPTIAKHGDHRRRATRRSRIRWTYNALADKDIAAGNPPIDVVVPTTGRFVGVYVQAISAYAPHPNAAKLWMEYLYSDEGQNIWLKGYCNPIRYDDHGQGQGRVDAAGSGQAAGHHRARSSRPSPRSPRPPTLITKRLATRRRRDRQVADRRRSRSDGDRQPPPPAQPGRATGAPRRVVVSWSLARARPLLRCSRSLFLVVPIVLLVSAASRTRQGNSTLQNYADLSHARRSSRRSATASRSASSPPSPAGIFGFLLAYAVILGGLPRFLRVALMTFSGVASNFAGVPLALAFIFTLGQLGLVTMLLKDASASTSTRGGFTLYSKLGLEIVYLYFQFPLMVLIIAPGHRRPEAGVARGGREHGRELAPVLAARSPCRS